ncbi:MAG: ABC transporter permease [Acidobacteria bacterium]|nr:ABC transporter permease [Acidobacteriota bacterium]
MRGSLLGEIVGMAVATLRTQKMRSALTILGVVIGITAIVGMTSLIRGFDESLRDSIRELGPDTITVMQFGLSSFMSGADFNELLKRPTLTPADARAIERRAAESIARVVLTLGEAGGPRGPTRTRVHYNGERTAPTTVIGTDYDYPEAFHIDIEQGRFFTEGEVSHRRRVVVIGQGPSDALFANVDPIGKTVRITNQPYTVIGVMGPRPGVGGFNADQDNFVLIPHTAYQKQFGLRVARMRRGRFIALNITAVPREGVAQEDALRDVERVMRIRHGLRLDEPNDFDMLTQDAALRLWDRVSGATFLALVAISSIALLVGGIGVMAIMTISVKERTREIGTRKAIGARRREILWQFLLEAAFLTGIGGVLGIGLGSAIGVGIHFATGFPVSLPWWSFALGIGFSALVGIVFGLFPAVRASSLDPIEALRYE